MTANYALTQADLALFAPNESALSDPIPAFFRVELRREFRHLLRAGPVQYPRAAVPLFYLRHGGLLVDGQLEQNTRRADQIPVPVNGEVKLNQLLGANEVTIEINPSDSSQVIAGANNAGVETYYSADGGSLWTVSGALPNTCCDPSMEWSPDGSVAYASALSGTLGVSFWRSFDGGETWIDRNQLTLSGSDKEFVHVDRSASSPYVGNVYLTYHNGNVMQFARSLPDGTGTAGDSFEIRSFEGAPKGIGSDITTTANGDLYYFWGATETQTITMLKSTNGGASFGEPVAITSTQGRYDFPIPAMETRRAWIYVAADSDRSSGPYGGSVYVAYTDTVEPESNSSPTTNHTAIRVGYTRDGGQTWQFSTPHSTTDADTVDRFNQWLFVDPNGAVHVVYYDTRHSTNRTGVDLYYTVSLDGGVSWNQPQRVSPETSSNLTDNQEWGDYNGLAVLGQKALPAWTDNRDGTPNSKDVYAADLTNIAAKPGFTLQSETPSQAACTPGALDSIDLSVASIQGFSNP